MAYFAPIHRPTSVRHSLTARFTSETEDDLIIAITNRLEVWRVTYDGAVFLHSRAINGTISTLSKLRPKDARRDMLFIGTDMNSYITVWWDDATKQIETPEVTQENFPDFVRASESTDRALVDQDGKFIAMLLWEGVISISRMEDRPKARKGPKSLRFLGQSRISELYVKSACFLPSITGPRIAFLHQKQHDWEEAQISIYPITSDDKHSEPSDFSPKVREHMFTPKDHLTSILIPIPSEFDENNRYHVRRATAAASRAYLGGLVAVGETTVIYMDGLNFEQVQAFLPEATLFTTWVQVDNRTYILGDDYGYLHVLRLVTEGTWVTRIEVAKFNQQISRASTLSYLGNGLLYLGSHYADSQLLRLDFNKLELEVLTAPNSFANNAPILDFALMDMGIRGRENAHRPDFSTGQARIVAGSGIWSDGSLRSIRSGVGADIVGVLDDFKDVSKMFALRFEGAEKVNMVAVSSLTDTRVFEFGIDGSIEELDFLPFLDFSQSSLVIRDVRGNQTLQVTASSATLRHKSSGKITKSWGPGGGSLISNASANDSYALIVVDGTKLISLDLNNQLAVAAKEAEPSSDGIEDEVTCVSTSHSFPSIGVVALWKSGTISLVNLTTMRISATFTIPKSEDSIAVPRDAALVQIHKENEGNPSLIVAMDDGMAVVFSILLADYSVSSMITVVLGSREGQLYVLPREEDGTNRVLVASDLPSLIYSETPSKYIFSATTFEDVTSIVSFDSDAFPGSLIIAANGQLLIGTIDDQRRTHVKTLPLKKTVRRLAYLPSQQAFILACLSKRLVNNEEVVESSLQLVDEIMFRPLGDPLLLEHKSHSQIPESLDILEFYDSIDGKVERLVVGTSYIESGSIETEASGTLTVFGIDEKKNVFPLVTWQTPSAISSVKVKDNLIFVGVVSGIRVFKYTETSPATGHLEKVASKSSILSPTSLDVCGDIVGVSDLTKSAFFFRFNTEKSEAFELIGQHRLNLWPTALACVAPHTWLQADSQGNVIVFNIEKQEKQKNIAERLALPTVEYISAVNIGEQVNTLRPLDITPEAGKLLGSQAIMTTAEGGVYLFGILAPEYRESLIHLQERITQHIKTLGDLSFAEYRAFRDAIYAEKEPQSFVVGEQLERFLEMSETMQEVVCEGLPISVANARNVIRRLKYMH
ncbi:hypothetical protein Cpir12675_002612 [Ceratocystis pirilliformis]|uniref:DNA damage-binding protein 1 n=1 Tax=Ceratocystis pirilliformis TaxID=259994 RepID=A0ABR3Z9Y1_9PEZI